MNLGIERFLILGCVGVLILELPQLICDIRLGDGFLTASPATEWVTTVHPSSTEVKGASLESDLLGEVESDEILAQALLNKVIELPTIPSL